MADTTRETFIAAIRDLADFLEANPTLPVPRHGLTVDIFLGSRDELARVARSGVSWEKNAIGSHFFLRRGFGPRKEYVDGYPVVYDVNVERDQVCRKVVTGRKLVPARPAEPAHYEETVTWVCDEALLAPAPEEVPQ